MLKRKEPKDPKTKNSHFISFIAAPKEENCLWYRMGFIIFMNNIFNDNIIRQFDVKMILLIIFTFLDLLLFINMHEYLQVVVLFNILIFCSLFSRESHCPIWVLEPHRMQVTAIHYHYPLRQCTPCTFMSPPSFSYLPLRFLQTLMLAVVRKIHITIFDKTFSSNKKTYTWKVIHGTFCYVQSGKMFFFTSNWLTVEIFWNWNNPFNLYRWYYKIINNSEKKNFFIESLKWLKHYLISFYVQCFI